MKSIIESIRKTRGNHQERLWIIHPVGLDYVHAIKSLPESCKIKFKPISMGWVISDSYMKEYLKKYPLPEDEESDIYQVDTNILKTFEDIERVCKATSSYLLSMIPGIKRLLPEEIKELMNIL